MYARGKAEHYREVPDISACCLHFPTPVVDGRESDDQKLSKYRERYTDTGRGAFYGGEDQTRREK
jgi:hypothetical protein